MKTKTVAIFLLPILLIAAWAFTSAEPEKVKESSDWVLVRIYEPGTLGKGFPGIFVTYPDGKTDEIVLRKLERQTIVSNGDIIYKALDGLFKQGYEITQMTGGNDFQTLILKK
jgi:hypothetical protein